MQFIYFISWQFKGSSSVIWSFVKQSRLFDGFHHCAAELAEVLRCRSMVGTWPSFGSVSSGIR